MSMTSPPVSVSCSAADSRHRTPTSTDDVERQPSLNSMSSVPSTNPSNAETSAQYKTEVRSPGSSQSSLVVGTAQDAALIHSMEAGEYTENEYDSRSLSSSVRHHIVEGGLRYHAYHSGQYLFPNDEIEQERDDLKHTLTVHLCEGNLFFAPVHELFEQGAHILDLGTGTGKWCIDMADNYPNCEVHGMDLSPIQPGWVPEKVIFFVDDIEHDAGWTYEEQMFDYIHIRHTLHSIRNRAELWDRIYKHLKPGGYVEVQEFQYVPACDDDSCDEPFAWRDFVHYLRDGMASMGTDIHGILYVEDELKAAGFQELGRKSLKCPMGPWAKKPRLQRCGFMLRHAIMMGLKGLTKRPFCDGLGWTSLQVEMFLIEVRKALTVEVDGLPKFHSYFPFHSVYGRKPLDADRSSTVTNPPETLHKTPAPIQEPSVHKSLEQQKP